MLGYTNTIYYTTHYYTIVYSKVQYKYNIPEHIPMFYNTVYCNTYIYIYIVMQLRCNILNNGVICHMQKYIAVRYSKVLYDISYTIV